MTLLQLAWRFGLLSLLGIGGMSAVMPEMQRVVVQVEGWATAPQFLQLFAVAQAAPGPNVLISSLVGWKVAGLPGALAALGGICGPSSVLAWWVSGLWERFRDSPWRAAIARAITPLAVGFIVSGGYVLCTPASGPSWRLWLIAGLSAAGLAGTRLNPLWFLAGGGVLGAILFT